MFQSLSDFVAEIVQATRPIASAPVVIELDEKGMSFRSGPLPLQSGIKTTAVLRGFQYFHVSYERKVQDTKSVTRGRIAWKMNTRKCMESLVAKTTAIKKQVPAAAGSSSKAVQSLPPTVPKENDVLHTAVPPAHLKLSENVRNALFTLSDAKKAV